MKKNAGGNLKIYLYHLDGFIQFFNPRNLWLKKELWSHH